MSIKKKKVQLVEVRDWLVSCWYGEGVALLLCVCLVSICFTSEVFPGSYFSLLFSHGKPFILLLVLTGVFVMRHHVCHPEHPPFHSALSHLPSRTSLVGSLSRLHPGQNILTLPFYRKLSTSFLFLVESFMGKNNILK